MQNVTLSDYELEQLAENENLPSVAPLPWRQCAPLIFFASTTCYALVYVVFVIVYRIAGA